jgi:CheY-like chemotaxis protein/AraC-like DNA-binding protein
VSNAYKYTNENGKIDIEVENTDKELSIRVRNTGLGIKKEDIDSVFNRFQILDNFERYVSQGKIQRTGIGLALTKSLVTLLNGKITVNSRENDYTLFTVELPVQKNIEIRPKQEIPLFVQPQEISPQMDAKQKSLILIIDDETEIRNLLHDILSPFYEIIEAADGNEGIEQLKHHRPDLIISDIIMPNMSGVELLNEIKKSRLTSHIPVVFLSSKATMDDQIANYERGLEFFIAKPFNPKLLLSVINQIIINRGSLKQFYNSSVSTIEEFNSNFVHSDEKKFLVSIADLIKNNMENELLGPDFICEKLNITRIILYRRIKELINSTPTDFIREVRLKEAERLIKTTKLTIQEIMYQTGFNNKSYFYTIFKTEYGVSPNEYRKKS